jgi:hypothetical protein
VRINRHDFSAFAAALFYVVAMSKPDHVLLETLPALVAHYLFLYRDRQPSFPLPYPLESRTSAGNYNGAKS